MTRQKASGGLAADGGYLRRPDGAHKYTAPFSVKLTDAQAMSLYAHANAAGKSVSTFIREILIGYLRSGR